MTDHTTDINIPDVSLAAERSKDAMLALRPTLDDSKALDVILYHLRKTKRVPSRADAMRFALRAGVEAVMKAEGWR